MGQSTDAILAYGYVWGDEASLFNEDEGDEWVEALAVRRGIPNPWTLYRDSGAQADHNALPYVQQEPAYESWKVSVGFDALLEDWDSARKAIKAEHPDISVGFHCSCDFPMPYICIASTKQQAGRGYPVTFDPRTMALEQDNINWLGYLAMFTDALGIDLTEAQGPDWFLVSNWC